MKIGTCISIGDLDTVVTKIQPKIHRQIGVKIKCNTKKYVYNAMCVRMCVCMFVVGPLSDRDYQPVLRATQTSPTYTMPPCPTIQAEMKYLPFMN